MSASPFKTEAAAVNDQLAEEVRAGLGRKPKSLASWLFYDAQGSALFEEITRLPEYYLTRAELALFLSRGAEMIARAAQTETLTLVELGAGSATKTQVLLRFLMERQSRATFYPVDVSRKALELAVSTLAPKFPTLEILPLEGKYREALDSIRGVDGRKLVLFMGSSIGNFHPNDAAALLADLRLTLREGDALLLGTDLRKEASAMLPAYDDSSGVTARFNKNVLARLNRELGAHFDLEGFQHVALWNERESRMEMHLEAVRAQTVHIDALRMDVGFAAGERIHTENSYKFTVPMVDRILEESGFVREQTWMDRRQTFAEHLARVQVH
jgi:L-histidine Nalpha-methyltransferase